jgi:alcohol dehydrogenase YqhD (iron-dependent ADH family)
MDHAQTLAVVLPSTLIIIRDRKKQFLISKILQLEISKKLLQIL